MFNEDAVGTMLALIPMEQRARNMSAIRGKNTKPELIVRRMVHRLGYRFRLHRKVGLRCVSLASAAALPLPAGALARAIEAVSRSEGDTEFATALKDSMLRWPSSW